MLSWRVSMLLKKLGCVIISLTSSFWSLPNLIIKSDGLLLWKTKMIIKPRTIGRQFNLTSKHKSRWLKGTSGALRLQHKYFCRWIYHKFSRRQRSLCCLIVHNLLSMRTSEAPEFATRLAIEWKVSCNDFHSKLACKMSLLFCWELRRKYFNSSWPRMDWEHALPPLRIRRWCTTVDFITRTAFRGDFYRLRWWPARINWLLLYDDHDHEHRNEVTTTKLIRRSVLNDEKKKRGNRDCS